MPCAKLEAGKPPSMHRATSTLSRLVKIRLLCYLYSLRGRIRQHPRCHQPQTSKSLNQLTLSVWKLARCARGIQVVGGSIQISEQPTGRADVTDATRRYC